jgi:hypothetical protein
LLVLFTGGCARLPDYARPRVDPAELGGPHTPDAGFTYRTLTRGDFRATALPAELQGHADTLLARSSIRIRPVGKIQVVIRRAYSGYFDRTIWSGRVQPVRFEAVMIPGRSWWNPAVPPAKTAYVLQHEQIHFALMELAARRLTRRAADELQDLFVVDTSRQGVEAQIKARIEEMIEEENRAALREHTDFDEDCSMYFDPRKQQWWYDEVGERLRETSGQGGGR